MAASRPTAAYALLWSDDVAVISRWAQSALGFTEQWSVGTDNQFEHAELTGFDSTVSINVRSDSRQQAMGPAGIALPVDSDAAVDALYRQATAAGAEIVQGPEHSPVAYSFTAVDPDGNQWWVHAETGMLDTLRQPQGSSDA